MKPQTNRNIFSHSMLLFAFFLINIFTYLPRHGQAQNPGDVDTAWGAQGYTIGGDRTQGLHCGTASHIIKSVNGLISICGGCIINNVGNCTGNRMGTLYELLEGGGLKTISWFLPYPTTRFTAHAYDTIGNQRYYITVGAADLRSAVFRIPVNTSYNTFRLDTTAFNATGTVKGMVRVTMDGTVSQEAFNDVAVQPNHKIIAVGRAGTSSQRWTLARFNSDGSFDNTFGASGNGQVLMGWPGGSAQALRVELLPSGKFLVAGLANGNTQGLLARFNANGILDSTFGVNGAVNIPENIVDMELLSNGSILFLAQFTTTLYQFDSSGNPDANFGTNGVAQLAASPFSSLSDIGVQSNGKIIIGGQKSDTKSSPCVARCKADGSIDNTFGNNGFVDISLLDTIDEFCNSLVVTQDDNIILVGNLGDKAIGQDNKDWMSVRLVGSDASLGILDRYNQADFLTIYPNPVESELTVKFELKERQAVSISLSDLQGKRVHQFTDKAEMMAGINQQLLLFPSGIPAGAYQVIIECGKVVTAIKVMKQ